MPLTLFREPFKQGFEVGPPGKTVTSGGLTEKEHDRHELAMGQVSADSIINAESRREKELRPISALGFLIPEVLTQA